MPSIWVIDKKYFDHNDNLNLNKVLIISAFHIFESLPQVAITETMRTKALILAAEDIFGLSMYKRKCIYYYYVYDYQNR